MKRISAALFFGFLFLAIVVQAAEEPVSFAGTWILNKEKSDQFPRSLTAMNTSVGDVSRDGGMGRGVSRGRGGSGGLGGGAGSPGGGFAGGAGRGGVGAQGPVGPVPLVIEQNGDQIKLIVKMQINGQEMPFIETIACDGKQHEEMIAVPNSPDKVKQKLKATLKNNKLVVERTTFGPPPDYMQTLNKRSYSISKDGKTITLETTTTNMMMSMIQKQVYELQ